MHWLKNRYALGIITAIIIIISGVFYAHSAGMTNTTKLNGNGCTCHGSANTAVTVTINGPASLAVNATGDYTVTITGGPLVRGGTDIAASSGTLAAADNSLFFSSGELTHSAPKAPVSGTVTFNFKYTAPATAGNVTLYANGNSVNFTGSSSGDAWNFAPNKSVTITSGTTDVRDDAIANDFVLSQNYPNPFNPSTKISYSTKTEGFVSLDVFDNVGEKVASLINETQSAGLHSVTFDASHLPSGIYLYRLTSNDGSLVKKMLLQK